MEFAPRIDLVFQDVDGQALLNLLNGELLKHPQQWAGFWSVTQADVTAHRSAYRSATSELHRRLTGWMNQWIDSGRQKDGSEAPGSRKVTPELSDVFEDYSSISRTVFSYQQGLPVAQLSSLRVGENSLAGDWPVEDDPTDHAEYEAVRIMAMLLLSADSRSRIARCRYRRCSRYFFLRQPLKPTYQNGCFCCPSHNRAMTAANSMKQRRDKCREKQIELAAKELLKHPPKGRSWYGDIALKNKMVRAVNQGMRRDPNRLRKIAINWITGHQKKIQTKVNQQQHQHQPPTKEKGK